MENRGMPENQQQKQDSQNEKNATFVIRVPSYEEVSESSQPKTTPQCLFNPSPSFSQAFNFIKNSEFYANPPPAPLSSSQHEVFNSPSYTASPRQVVQSESPSTSVTSASGNRNSILVSHRQKGNPLLKHIRNVRWAFAEINCDYLVGQNACALYLSLRYHLLHPDYLYFRIRELQKNFKLRVVLCHVDVEDVIKPLLEVTKTALLHDCTLLCGWSLEECGRYLETIKVYENKPANLIQGQMDMDYLSREDYRPVMAVDIGELPPRKYGDVVKNGKLTTRHGYKDIPDIAGPLLRAFPHVVDDYPQLGKFLLLDGEGNVPNAAIHQLMARVCSWPDPKKVRCRLFEVNNMIVRLSPVEFSMITGLHFQDLRTDEDKDKDEDLKEIAFPDYEESKKQVPNDLLLKKIKKLLSKNNPERYPFVINLTFVWLITNLLDIPNRQLNVPDEFFKLCSNLDACQNYPWGIKAWDAIVDDCFNRIGEIEGPGRTRAWNAYGFIHFYAFWMLEALEGADVQLDATRRRDYRHSYPRMLRWSLSNNSPKNEDFKKFLVNDVQVVYPRLKPDVVELRSSYFHGTLCWFERRYFARRADALRLNDDDIFCDDYVSFIAAPPAPAPSPSPPRRQRTPSPAHHTTYSAFPESFQDAGQSHFQAAGQSSFQAAGLPSWWGDLQQMNTARDEAMYAEMRAQRELISAQSRQIAVQTTQIAEQTARITEQNAMMTRYGTQLDGYGDQMTRYGTQLDGYGVQLTEYGVLLRGHGEQIDQLGGRMTSLEESFRGSCNLGDRQNEVP